MFGKNEDISFQLLVNAGNKNPEPFNPKKRNSFLFFRTDSGPQILSDFSLPLFLGFFWYHFSLREFRFQYRLRYALKYVSIPHVEVFKGLIPVRVSF